jgi:hypothetical protein
MIDRITKSCEAKFERYVEELFRHPKMLSKGYLAEVPIIGGARVLIKSRLLYQNPS